MRAVLLTEGSREQGFGHVSRCLSIAQGFASAGIRSTIVVDTNSRLAPILGGIKHLIGNWKKSGALDRYISGADVVVVDSYTVRGSLVALLAYAANVPVFVDDNLQQQYQRGLVLNGSIYADKLAYPKRACLDLLLGTRYIPLRKAFAVPVSRATRPTLEKVLVMFGGTDARNLTPKALATLLKLKPPVKIDLVVGKGFGDSAHFHDAGSSRVTIFESLDDKQVRARMSVCDAALSSSGQTLYELARMGVPTVAVGVADNQTRNLNGFSEAGIVKSLGWYADGSFSLKIEKAFRDVASAPRRKAMSIQGMKSVDGQGPARVASAVINYHRRYGLTVRPAVARDAMDILRLSNEKSVRAVSFSNIKITEAAHKQWFREKMNSANFFILIARRAISGSLVGQLRYQVAKTTATISISVSVRARGSNVGKILFYRSLAPLQARFNVKRIDALIRQDNQPSQRFFESIGFEKVRVLKDQPAKPLLYRKEL